MRLFERFRTMWPTARPLTRDKADTLLLLGTCALVLAPHAGHLPLWAPLICAILLGWRGWITWRGNRMPPRAVLTFLALAILTGVYASFHTLLGQEAGVTMLALLLSLKLLEMRARRDLFVVLFLSLFLLLANFFYSQSILTAAYTIAAVIVLVTTQLTFQYAGEVPPLKRRLRVAFNIVALAVPLTLVLFVLFPRIQGPLWGLPRDAGSGHSGLSDTMAPGNITQLALSDEIAFRVKFRDPPPPQSKLYWRGIVLGNYDGRTWTPWPTEAFRGQVSVRTRGAPIRYEITLEPSGRRWLFALELPLKPPQLPGQQTRFNQDLELQTLRPISDRIRYEVDSHVDFALQPDLRPVFLRFWLALPAGYNPRTRAFAASLRRRSAGDAEIVDAVLKFFHTERFSYTLEPPPLGTHAVDEFLFDTRAGFCEHYASAFVVLMRAAGIPARVVTGYQGGTINPIDGYLVVRQSDAHAWAEVWLAGRGWVRIDPTAAVAPERVEKNLSTVLPRRALGGLITLDVGRNAWLSSLRFNWDAITNRWNQWVLSYTLDKQQSLLRSLGFKDPDWRTLMALLSAAGLLVFVAIALPLLRNRQKLDPVNVCYRALCDVMARRGLPRALHEGPRAYRLRLTAADSPLETDRKSAVVHFLQLYETLQYGAVDKTARTAALSELKSLLSACR
jgi:transglutaminase-like putative cysteine protease